MNEFADVIEEKEPKFAAWLRRHGKVAIIKDDEVERLERAERSQYSAGARSLSACLHVTRLSVCLQLHDWLADTALLRAYAAYYVIVMTYQ